MNATALPPPAVTDIGDRASLFVGPCDAFLGVLADDTIDAMVTDPPAGIGFMGKDWDGDKGGRDQWVAWLAGVMRECLRVLKPGAHALVWALPRTSHWTATALEDAGFEVRDVVMHLFGTGFPKSLDVAKAIDKRREDDPRRVCRFLRAAMDAKGLTSKQVAEHFGFHSRMVDHWAARDTDSQPTVPTLVQWEQLRGLLGFGWTPEIDAEVYRLNERKGTLGEAWLRRPVTGSYETPAAGQTWRASNGVAADLTAKERRDEGASPEAARWEGWGTALKPAAEHWILCRKPFNTTVAQNVTTYGTGALNISATRPPSENWPAHLVLDDFTAGALGSKAEYFYVAKPSTAERDAGCEQLPAKSGGEATDREDGSAGVANPRAGAGRGGGRRNTHPTVKPIALMRWLCRLITPPGGVVLDPFAGSGTTGVAALAEGLAFLGAEQDAEYAQIASARLEHAARQP